MKIICFWSPPLTRFAPRNPLNPSSKSHNHGSLHAEVTKFENGCGSPCAKTARFALEEPHDSPCMHRPYGCERQL